jgi:hypothetical protein
MHHIAFGACRIHCLYCEMLMQLVKKFPRETLFIAEGGGKMKARFQLFAARYRCDLLVVRKDFVFCNVSG